MTSLPSQDVLLHAMQDIVGANGCLVADADTESFVTDYRRIYRGKSPLVVMPSSTEQVSRVMAWCYAHDVPVVPQGGNT